MLPIKTLKALENQGIPGAPKTMKNNGFHLQKTWFLDTKKRVFDGFGAPGTTLFRDPPLTPHLKRVVFACHDLLAGLLPADV